MHLVMPVTLKIFRQQNFNWNDFCFSLKFHIYYSHTFCVFCCSMWTLTKAFDLYRQGFFAMCLWFGWLDSYWMVKVIPFKKFIRQPCNVSHWHASNHIVCKTQTITAEWQPQYFWVIWFALKSQVVYVLYVVLKAPSGVSVHYYHT